jgi:hypothetical protein
MIRIAAVMLLFAVTAGAFAVLAQSKEAKAPPVQELAAKRVEKVELVAELNETWKGAASIKTPTYYKAEEPGPEVEVRALNDGENIYFMARWKDETKSDTKKAWQFTKGAWSQLKGDEDRVAFAFDHNVEGFAEKGCMTLCHEGSMETPAEGQRADLWHWKAARGGQNGRCDDQNFGRGENGRADDAGKSAYESNAGEDGKAPKWVWKEDADTTKAFTADTARDLPKEFKPDDGYTVPSIRLRDPAESRGDITCAARWADGMWTVVLKRKIDTGNKDDTQFAQGATINFALAVFNDTGAKTGKEHAKSPVVRLLVQ